jgi:carbonic anhydrase/acetyltransferase-like protein (isoleucine patch superfamily)
VTIWALDGAEPDIHPDAFVHPDATVIGRVVIGPHASIWPRAVLRADFGGIEIGARTSIQDGTVVHTTAEWPTIIGPDCVVGHNAHLEGCSVGERCLIGSGSIVLNRAEVQADAGVGAAALVPEDFVVPSRHIALGVPARLRPAPELSEWVEYGVAEYLKAVDLHRGMRRVQ